MNPTHDAMIKKAIRRVPHFIRDDAYQAGCVGLILGLKECSNKENPDGYLFRCIRNEVIKEMAILNDIFVIDTKTLLRLLKIKKAKAYEDEPQTAYVEDIERMLNQSDD